ncbi:hypothetical protein [Phytohabitans houttuyneae]|uniref:FAD/NAD(P)-binding domain-containing protein n=1 Tax=Phytohabitans houttuyneae TaxID=1076126 RepID=A0A6V8KG58_9ACTN|nr:hypothetical protein [Phytohabitans houttuyneae]GFJ84223.1 hypothetical protein Phou_084030 [Phytohabitans houttuyneae]
MTADGAYVIVGAGQAGAMAAQTLREEGFGGGIVLVGQEDDRPYEALIRSGKPVDADRLADPEVPLESLVDR